MNEKKKQEDRPNQRIIDTTVEQPDMRDFDKPRVRAAILEKATKRK